MKIGDKVLVTAPYKVGYGCYGKVVGIFGYIDGRPAVEISGKNDTGCLFGGVYFCDELEVIKESDYFSQQDKFVANMVEAYKAGLIGGAFRPFTE